MAGVKRNVSSASSSSALKWQNFSQKRGSTSGKKTLPEPTSIQQMAVMLVLHICRKIVFYDTEIKVGIYFTALFLSIIFDFLPVPRCYFARKDNILNSYMVKIGWGWTFGVCGAFMSLTSWVICCGDKSWVKRHMYRLLVGTAIWYVWTTLFVYIDAFTSVCHGSDKTVFTKTECTRKGLRWHGFDISGHSFLLVFCSLMIMEESKAFRGWERIGELLRNEEYEDEGPLKQLSVEQLQHLKTSYEKFSPYVKATFIALAFLVVVWDVMLIFTILYFHSMIQKVAGGMIAIVCWYVTYRMWYYSKTSPGLPGQGPFRYSDLTPRPPVTSK